MTTGLVVNVTTVGPTASALPMSSSFDAIIAVPVAGATIAIHAKRRPNPPRLRRAQT
jgi:hypothetical protein